MDHTYLRYECADAFGLTIASGSSKAPTSNSVIQTLRPTSSFGSNNNNNIVVTTTGSCITGFHLRTNLPIFKLGHRQQLSGGVGTGRALNSDEVVCIDIQQQEQIDDVAGSGVGGNGNEFTVKIATGWVDGAVRVFDINHPTETTGNKPHGVIHSLLNEENIYEDFVKREPLVLNGHNQSPIRTVVFDPYNSGRLASGGSDGGIVLWDIIAEIGLFRFVGHRGPITNISFVRCDKLDILITSSLDGLVKIWDINGQCCIQTIASHRGEVWTSTCRRLLHAPSSSSNEQVPRWRLITGGNDGQARVWSIEPSSSKDDNQQGIMKSTDLGTKMKVVVIPEKSSDDTVCHFIGTLIPPPNIPTSAEKILCIHYDHTGKYVGILQANSKNVDVYLVRSIEQSNQKRQRRLRRRQEKETKKKANLIGNDDDDDDNNNMKKDGKGRKRGILDDPESPSSEDDGDAKITDNDMLRVTRDPKLIKASDEFEYIGTIRCSHKVRDFTFVSKTTTKGGELCRIVCALSTNALETHSLSRTKTKQSDNNMTATVITSDAVNTMDMYGHPTGIRSIALSSDDKLACTVSKNVTKVWNVLSRRCILSLSPTSSSSKRRESSSYGLCAIFLPGNMHVVVGTREGHLIVINISAGEVVYFEEKAHDGAIWSIDVKNQRTLSSNDELSSSVVSLVTGSADKTVKFWSVISQDDSAGAEESAGQSEPMLVQTRTLQMNDDVVAVRYSSSSSANKTMVFVSALDSTIKVFFDDSLKLFLSLYGHKLPALAIDGSDDDAILASGGADKTVKIWGLDFGDTHRTLHGHEDSITDLRFIKRTHYFVTCSKDCTVRYWDGDRFQQILLLNGHCAEVNCVAVSRTGAFFLSGGMDRQVRVWERTKDMVFLEEERERELEQLFDKVSDRNEGGTALILDRKRGGSRNEEGDDEMLGEDDNEPQSEEAVKTSVLSVSSGDRIMEALERADQELKDNAAFRRIHGSELKRQPNLLMLGLEPASYILWVLRTVKSAELEQSLLVLPLTHVERLMFYLVLLLRSGRGVELCSRVAVFIVKTHQNQIIATRSMISPLRELRRLLRLRLSEARDMIGFDLAAMKVIARVANDRKQTFIGDEAKVKDIWAGLGLGSDVAAVVNHRNPKKR